MSPHRRITERLGETIAWTAVLVLLVTACAPALEFREGSTSNLVKRAYFSKYVDSAGAMGQTTPLAATEFDPREDDLVNFVVVVDPPPGLEKRQLIVRGTLYRPDGTKDQDFQDTFALVRPGSSYWTIKKFDAPLKPFPGKWTADLYVEDQQVGLYAFVLLPGGQSVAPLPRGVPGLIAALKDDDPFRRALAADALGRDWARSPEVKAAIPVLVAALDDPSGHVAEYAETALLALAKAHPEALAAVAEPLRAPDAGTRYKAIHRVARIGEPARVTIPTLVEMMKSDSNGMIRKAAVEAIAHFGVTPAQVPIMIDALRDAEPGVRHAAATVLKDRTEEVVTVIERQLKDGSGDVRAKGAEATRGFASTEPVSVIRSLATLLADPDPRVRTAAARGLAEQYGEAWPVISAALQHRDARVRATAVEAIASLPALGAAESRAAEVRRLTAVVRDPDRAVRSSAVRLIAEIGRSAREMANALRAGGHIGHAQRHEATVNRAALAIVDATEDAAPEIRAEAERALREIRGPGDAKP